MGASFSPVILALCAALIVWHGVIAESPYAWMGRDKFDVINEKITSVTAENCKYKPKNDLRLDRAAVSQKPVKTELLSQTIFPNRTSLLHVHNMALNRAFFWSLINQKLADQSKLFKLSPMLMYYYMSVEANVAASEPYINGSGIFMDNHVVYATWYQNLEFNRTLPVFGPRAWRADDYNEGTNWLREPTNNTIDIQDYGAGLESNYTDERYVNNPWYHDDALATRWLPDYDRKTDSFSKYTYHVAVKYSDEPGKFRSDQFETFDFHGPPAPGQKEKQWLPVSYTRPYFDCGRSNKWIISAVSPIVDYMPRYSGWKHMRRQRFVGVATMDIDFLAIDYNPCEKSEGNLDPNIFAGTDRCRPSTMCQPVSGYGFRRGGYECVCRPGYRYPYWQLGPFAGWLLEEATEAEYNSGAFDCQRVGWRHVLPLNIDTSGARNYTSPFPELTSEGRGGRRRRSLAGYHAAKRHREHMIKKETDGAATKESMRVRLEKTAKVEVDPNLRSKIERELTKSRRWLTSRRRLTLHRARRSAFDEVAFNKTIEIFKQIEKIRPENCHQFSKPDLVLPTSVAYGASRIFEPQGRTALRLANFLSNFMQNIDEMEDHGNLLGDRLLNVEELFAEVFANVMGDFKLQGSGIFFDIDKFRYFKPNVTDTREFFGPYAWKTVEGEASTFYAEDKAGKPNPYIYEEFFANMKSTWASNPYGLRRYTTRAKIREDMNVTRLVNYEHYPMHYEAADYQHGEWSVPYFDCAGELKTWILRYTVPFFGLNKVKTRLEFKGVVVADVKLSDLDIQQCPDDFYVPNAYKNTARCDFETTVCVNLPGKKFRFGNYRCECKQGHEYPHSDIAWYYDGQQMEEEYRKMMAGQINRFHTLKCREAGASAIAVSRLLLVSAIVAFIVNSFTR